jgi:hypothetical protein
LNSIISTNIFTFCKFMLHWVALFFYSKLKSDLLNDFFSNEWLQKKSIKRSDFNFESKSSSSLIGVINGARILSIYKLWTQSLLNNSCFALCTLLLVLSVYLLRICKLNKCYAMELTCIFIYFLYLCLYCSTGFVLMFVLFNRLYTRTTCAPFWTLLRHVSTRSIQVAQGVVLTGFASGTRARPILHIKQTKRYTRTNVAAMQQLRSSAQ